MEEVESLSVVAKEVSQLEHRARCKRRTGQYTLESEMQCIHSDSNTWEERIQQACGTTIQDRPQVLESETRLIRTGLGRLYITIGLSSGRPFEVFCHVGMENDIGHPDVEEVNRHRANAEEVGRLASLCLRAGIPVREVVEQLRGIQGPTPVRWERKLVYGVGDALARTLSEYIEKD
jgi:hypothetical protein